MKEGMKTARTIPSSFISSQPASDDVDAVRPGDNKKWTVAKDSKPELTIQLVPAAEEGLPLGRVQVKGDMSAVIVYVKSSEGEEFKPVAGDDDQPKVSSCWPWQEDTSRWCGVVRGE